MKEKIRWGIIGTGVIASHFAEDLLLVEGCVLEAVASRDMSKATSFAEKYHANKSYGSYEELAKDSDIDVIYIATPHTLHKENTIMCLEHHKAVLCEKPFALNAEEANEMINCARKNKVFLMEAMWTRFLPVIRMAREAISRGEIGHVRWVKADFAFLLNSDYSKEDRLLNKALGGGALLDIGIYAISFVRMIMKKKPESIKSTVVMGETGVDLSVMAQFTYDQKESAMIYASLLSNAENSAYISGTGGSISIPNFWMAEEITIQKSSGETRTHKVSKRGKGYSYEIGEVNNCLQNGQLESSTMSLDESYEIMVLLDQIKAMDKEN